MRRQIQAAQEAARLWRSNSTAETVAAVLLLLAFIGIPLFQMYTSE